MMKGFYSVLVFSLISLNVISQEPELGMNSEPEFAITTAPEKWKNESAVIIGQKTEYLFGRVAGRNNGALVRIKEFVHKRILLQDKNALENFSTFNYVTMGADGKAEYRIVKVGGKTINVDMKSAIEEDREIPAIYKPIYYKMNVKFFKIAIPDLEVGDIIDYTLRSTYEWDMRTSGVGFNPFIFSLSNSYPTMYQQYRFTMADGMKVKYRNYNGAPNLKFDPKASVYGDRISYLSYYVLDKDREKSSEERWSYELRNTPSVKFQVILYSDNDDSKKSLGNATVDRSGLDITSVYKYYVGAAAYRTTTVNTLVAYTTQYIVKKKADGVLKTNDDIIRETYYCMRKVFLEMYYKGPVHSELEKYMTSKKVFKKIQAEKKKAAEQKEEKEDEIRINSLTFATALRMALAGQGIPAELQVYVPRQLGAWRDAIFMEELDFILRVKSNRKWYYLEAFNNFDAFGTPYSYLDGAEGYAIGYDEPDRYYRANIIPTTFKDNLDKQDYTISFNESMDIVKAERVNSYTGIEKSSRIGAANLDRSYLAFDFEKYYAEPLKDKGKRKKDEEVIDMADTKTYDDPEKEDRIAERREYFENELKEKYDVEKYNEFELIKDGRYGDSSLLQYRESFLLKKLVSKAGRNYIFEIGKLIGDQVKLEQSELTKRDGDIWIPYARSIQNDITVNIPAGYTVEKLDELNLNIDNESGAFLSTAQLEGEKLVITTKKVYKKNYDKKEAWANYIAFLEPAYKFSQAKIVLKKK